MCASGCRNQQNDTEVIITEKRGKKQGGILWTEPGVGNWEQIWSLFPDFSWLWPPIYSHPKSFRFCTGFRDYSGKLLEAEYKLFSELAWNLISCRSYGGILTSWREESTYGFSLAFPILLQSTWRKRSCLSLSRHWWKRYKSIFSTNCTSMV
jgi:hypothetical protein